MAEPDHYSLLGVPRTATRDQIQVAYRNLAKQYHPDIAGDGAGDQMRRLNIAWECLRDAERRERYNLTLPRYAQAGGRNGAPPAPPRPASDFRTSGPPPGYSPRKWRPLGTPFENGHADWYAYLGIDEDADLEEIRNAIAYRRVPALHSRGRPWAEDLLARLSKIETILTNPANRRRYDQTRETLRTMPRKPEGARTATPVRPARKPLPDIPAEDLNNWYAIAGCHARTSDAGVRDALAARFKELESAQVSATEYGRRKALLQEAARVLGHPARRQAYDAARTPA